MAKTIDSEKNSTAAATDAERQARDVEETELVNETEPDDAFDAEDSDQPEAGEELAVAPVSGERAPRTGAGVYVPDALLKNPLTRGLAEAYIELRKVTWPTRQDAWNMTIVVIIVSAIMSVLLALSDYGLGRLLTYLVNLGLGK